MSKRKDVSLKAPYTGARIGLQGLRINANGLNVIAGRRAGQEVDIEDCEIYNARSVYEYDSRETRISIHNSVFPDWVDADGKPRPAVLRYIVYSGAIDASFKPIIDRPVNSVLIESILLGSSYYECPVRIEGGVALFMREAHTTDVPDRSFKANSVLRFHGTDCAILSCALKGRVRFGTPHLIANRIVADHLTVVGGIKWEGEAATKRFTNCTMNGKPYTEERSC